MSAFRAAVWLRMRRRMSMAVENVPLSVIENAPLLEPPRGGTGAIGAGRLAKRLADAYEHSPSWRIAKLRLMAGG